jgi:hypothetical protein
VTFFYLNVVRYLPFIYQSYFFFPLLNFIRNFLKNCPSLFNTNLIFLAKFYLPFFVSSHILFIEKDEVKDDEEVKRCHLPQQKLDDQVEFYPTTSSV